MGCFWGFGANLEGRLEVGNQRWSQRVPYLHVDLESGHCATEPHKPSDVLYLIWVLSTWNLRISGVCDLHSLISRGQ